MVHPPSQIVGVGFLDHRQIAEHIDPGFIREKGSRFGHGIDDIVIAVEILFHVRIGTGAVQIDGPDPVIPFGRAENQGCLLYTSRCV